MRPARCRPECSSPSVGSCSAWRASASRSGRGPPRRLAVTIAIFAFGGSVAGYAFDRLLTSNTPQGIPVTGQPRVRDWVDRSADQHGRAARLSGLPALGPERDPVVGRRALEQPRPAGVRRSGRQVDVHALPRRDAPARLRARGLRRHGALAAVRARGRERLSLRAAGRGEGLESRPRPAQGEAAVPRRPGRAAAWSRTAGPGLGDPPRCESTGSPVRRPSRRCSTRRRRRPPPPPTASVTQLERWIPVRGRPCGRPSASPREGHADLTLETGRSATVDGPPIGPEPGPSREIGLALSGVNREPTGTPCSP